MAHNECGPGQTRNKWKGLEEGGKGANQNGRAGHVRRSDPDPYRRKAINDAR